MRKPLALVLLATSTLQAADGPKAALEEGQALMKQGDFENADLIQRMRKLFDTFGPLNVPVPPEPRLYRALFDAASQPGERLVVTGRATVFTDPPSQSTRDCPGGR